MVLPLVVNYITWLTQSRAGTSKSRERRMRATPGADLWQLLEYVCASHPPIPLPLAWCAALCSPPLARSVLFGPVVSTQPTNQPHIASSQQITRNSRPHPTMLVRDTAAAHYHPLPIIPALPYCRSFSFSAQHTRARTR